MTTYNPHNNNIEVWSGGVLDLANPEPSDIHLEDIATGLSNACRYANQPLKFYSVAEHSCLVAAKLEVQGEHPLVVMHGLHHDDSEAYLGDHVRPLKNMLPELELLHDKFTRVIEEALGLGSISVEDRSKIKDADNWAVGFEVGFLKKSEGEGWWHRNLYDLEDSSNPKVNSVGYSPSDARATWLRYHEYICGALGWKS